MRLILGKKTSIIIGVAIVLGVKILAGCSFYGRKINISNNYPYKEVIGKSFILKKDFYLYRFLDGSGIAIGNASDINVTMVGLPKIVDMSYVGLKTSEFEIIGILKKGDIVTINAVFYKEAVENSSYWYEAVAKSKAAAEYGKFNINFLMNRLENPPYTDTWSDPPIFNPNIAMPLKTDGVWWK